MKRKAVKYFFIANVACLIFLCGLALGNLNAKKIVSANTAKIVKITLEKSKSFETNVDANTGFVSPYVSENGKVYSGGVVQFAGEKNDENIQSEIEKANNNANIAATTVDIQKKLLDDKTLINAKNAPVFAEINLNNNSLKKINNEITDGINGTFENTKMKKQINDEINTKIKADESALINNINQKIAAATKNSQPLEEFSIDNLSSGKTQINVGTAQNYDYADQIIFPLEKPLLLNQTKNTTNLIKITANVQIKTDFANAKINYDSQFIKNSNNAYAQNNRSVADQLAAHDLDFKAKNSNNLFFLSSNLKADNNAVINLVSAKFIQDQTALIKKISSANTEQTKNIINDINSVANNVKLTRSAPFSTVSAVNILLAIISAIYLYFNFISEEKKNKNLMKQQRLLINSKVKLDL